MNRWQSSLIVLGALCGSFGALLPIVCAQESYPVVHREPITLRVIDGNGHGAPLAHVHLTLIAGYDSMDMKHQMFRESALTDETGEARLSRQMANLPLLQVWVQKLPLCQEHPRSEPFIVERIRSFGVSAPNQCGTVVAEETPGVLTIFVRKKIKHGCTKALPKKF